MRRRICEILNNPRPDDAVGRAISLGLLLLIAANVAANILESDRDIAARAPEFFRTFEIISVAVFTVEYVLRLWSAGEDPRFAGSFGWLRKAFTPMALVDLAAFAPFYITLAAPGMLDLRYLRVLRLLRLFRLLRSRPIADAFAMLARVIQSKRAEIGVTLALVAAAMLLSAGAMYMIEHDEPGTQFTSIPRAMWWAIITITTIGYGDMVPATPLGHVLAGFVGFLGICALALPVGILSSGFIDEINRRRAEPQACPHCGKPVE